MQTGFRSGAGRAAASGSRCPGNRAEPLEQAESIQQAFDTRFACRVHP
jgi:hypothetical protein